MKNHVAHNLPYRVFVHRLVELRAGIRLMTQRDLAEKIGVSTATIGKIERGERLIDVIEWLQILEALEADPMEELRCLLTRIDDVVGRSETNGPPVENSNCESPES